MKGPAASKNENSPQRQSIVNCFNSLRWKGTAEVVRLTSFFERLIISDNEKDPLAYSILLDLYSQRIPEDDKKEKYLDYDTQICIRQLWERIRKNGNISTRF